MISGTDRAAVGGRAGFGQLDDDTFRYLSSLVRMDIRKHQGDVGGFTARPGQPLDEAHAVRAHFAAKQEFREGVLAALRAARGLPPDQVPGEDRR
jgi:hypothetical protein